MNNQQLNATANNYKQDCVQIKLRGLYLSAFRLFLNFRWFFMADNFS